MRLSDKDFPELFQITSTDIEMYFFMYLCRKDWWKGNSTSVRMDHSSRLRNFGMAKFEKMMIGQQFTMRSGVI